MALRHRSEEVTRKRLVRILALALAAAALPSSSGRTQQLPDSFKLALTPQEVVAVEQGLMELPYKTSANLLQKITGQIQEQNTEWQKAHGAPASPPAPETSK